MKASIRALVAQAVDALRANGTVPTDLELPDFVIERPKTRAQGDFSTNAAMLLAKPARSNPRAVAQAIVDALPANNDIARVEIAGPGFINFRLAGGGRYRCENLREATGREDRRLRARLKFAGLRQVLATPGLLRVLALFLVFYVTVLDRSYLEMMQASALFPEGLSVLSMFWITIAHGTWPGFIVGFIAMQWFKSEEHTMPNRV